MVICSEEVPSRLCAASTPIHVRKQQLVVIPLPGVGAVRHGHRLLVLRVLELGVAGELHVKVGVAASVIRAVGIVDV